tara:strand:+ start:1207 stop:1824 length:618 start_codon:yes stop_codon:yes gene_type:complete
MLKRKKLIIFDLDGVLINSLPNMRAALKKTSLSLNIKLNFNLYSKYLGLPFEQIMKKMGITKNINIIKFNYSFFSKMSLSKIKIKKKHLEELNHLKNKYNFAVFTSKDKLRTQLILKQYKFFKYIVTSDDVDKGKPYPDGLIQILKNTKNTKNETIYIGDSVYDYKAAKKFGIKYLHAKWGYEKNLKNTFDINEISNFLEIEKYL